MFPEAPAVLCRPEGPRVQVSRIGEMICRGGDPTSQVSEASPGAPNRLWTIETGRPAGPLSVESAVEYYPHMETVQIVVDKELLTAADKAARRLKQNRSALVREALREYLLRLETRAREQRDREGYAKKPQALKESHAWEMEAAWPER